MNTNSLPVIALLAAVVAVILLPVSALGATLAFTVTGMLCMLVADYGRRSKPAMTMAPVVPFNAPACSGDLRKAA
jgi:hypothetical protein